MFRIARFRRFERPFYEQARSIFHSADVNHYVTRVLTNQSNKQLIKEPTINSSDRIRTNRSVSRFSFRSERVIDDRPKLPPMILLYPQHNQSISHSSVDQSTDQNKDQQLTSTSQNRLSPAVKPPIGQTTDQSTNQSSDPDGGFTLEPEAARASLMAFAEFEAKQRAKKLQAAKPSDNQSINQPVLARPSQSVIADHDPITANMDAFVALERALAMKKLKAKQDNLDDPLTKPTNQSINQPINQSINQKPKLVEPPRMPEPYECCGMSCPNCVWIEYAQQMQDYEDQQKP